MSVETNIVRVAIEDEMRGAYLDYSMSVIVGRALPDVRDGLKPVHRRVLFAMHDLGNDHKKPYKKSARVVGDVIGKYHPHGDVAVYDTIVRMAQDFSLRYPLIDGQGNFGSVDGDAPAAMRYTEIRMSAITDLMLADIDRETVDFNPNYDDSLKEPSVLPTKIPHLLINGSTGIAVGMATNIPPHNLGEVVSGLLALIEDPGISIDALCGMILGPDFPTAGIMYAGTGLRDAYHTGRGSIMIRGRAEIESWKNDRERIIVTELPYQVNKARLVEKIADLVRDKKIEGISDLRDESDRTGMRIVIEIRKNENANVILNKLYKMTSLQDSYGIHFLAISHNQPRTMNLKDMLVAFLDHRKEVVTRRTQYDLKKAQARAHILEGLTRAVGELDRVLVIIRGADSGAAAKQGLMETFAFSELQAQAILDLKLQRLTHLERDKISEEYLAVQALMRDLRDILGSDVRVLSVIADELRLLTQTYADRRRTEIVNDRPSLEMEDLIKEEQALVSITHAGYVKRADLDQFRSQHRGGRGVRGVNPGDEDFVTALYTCSTLSVLLCFTNLGRVYSLRVHQVPEAARSARGKAIVNLIPLVTGEKVRAVMPVDAFDEKHFVFMVTRAGIVKKVALQEFQSVRSSGIMALSTDQGDELVAACVTNGEHDIVLTSMQGLTIVFDECDVRAMGRSARGVIGMTLEASDRIVSMEAVARRDLGAGSGGILIVSECGYGKRTQVSEYRRVSRGGSGVITMRVSDKTGLVVGARQVVVEDDVMLVSNKGQMIRIGVSEISELGRSTQGVRLFQLQDGEKIVGFEQINRAVADS